MSRVKTQLKEREAYEKLLKADALAQGVAQDLDLGSLRETLANVSAGPDSNGSTSANTVSSGSKRNESDKSINDSIQDLKSLVFDVVKGAGRY